MSSKTKTWLVIAIVFIIGGILLAGVGVAMGGTLSYTYVFEDGKLNFSKSASADFVSDTVSVSEFRKLIITSDTIDVNVVKGDKYTISYSLPESLVPEITGSETLNIHIPSEDGFHVNLFSLYTDDEPYVTVTIPDSSEKEFDIETSTGDISIENVNFNGDIKASTGDIKITSAKLGSTNIETSTGDLQIIDIDSPELKRTASTGQSYFENCRIDKLTLKTRTGDVQIDDSRFDSIKAEGSTSDITINDTSVKDVKIEVSTGECKLEIKGNASDYSCQLKSSTGDIKYDGESFEKSYSHNGSGNGSIIITTSTGDIKVKFD
ncbi:MAG: DUF4097 family beta strand repeat protein [Lachnospiraceae bacterium]|nr:DUF4097 family beta strand repeat protein [Lachnospiraceae bacterium]